MAGIMNVFAGLIGADHFWAGNIILGVAKLLTLGGLGLWVTADIFLWASGSYYATKGCHD